MVTNQLTTHLIKSNNVTSQLSPALGESMGHRVTQRLLLGRIPGNTIAAIYLKGNNQSCTSAKFKVRGLFDTCPFHGSVMTLPTKYFVLQITKEGIRD